MLMRQTQTVRSAESLHGLQKLQDLFLYAIWSEYEVCVWVRDTESYTAWHLHDVKLFDKHILHIRTLTAVLFSLDIGA